MEDLTLATGYRRSLVEDVEKLEAGLYYSAARCTATSSDVDRDAIILFCSSHLNFILLDAGTVENWFLY